MSSSWPTRTVRRAGVAGLQGQGSRFWAGVVIAPMHDPDGALVGFVKTTRNLTQSRSLEEERVRLAQAEEAVRLRDEFLSIASHELRTPLTALQLQLQGARDRASSTDERVIQKIDSATRVGNRLAQLIEALLDVSRIATGHLSLNLEACNLAEPAREVVERLGEAASRAGCHLSIIATAAAPGRWDRLRIEQVAMNLIANAIKYAAGQPIAVTVSRGGEMAVLEVQTKGPASRRADYRSLSASSGQRRPGTTAEWGSGCTSRAKSRRPTEVRLPSPTCRMEARASLFGCRSNLPRSQRHRRHDARRGGRETLERLRGAIPSAVATPIVLVAARPRGAAAGRGPS